MCGRPLSGEPQIDEQASRMTHLRWNSYRAGPTGYELVDDDTVGCDVIDIPVAVPVRHVAREGSWC